MTQILLNFFFNIIHLLQSLIIVLHEGDQLDVV